MTCLPHMQTLPIKYFDTHTFGDTMSHFTNDTDTLRQMISRAFRKCSPLRFCYRGVLHHALHQRMVDAGGYCWQQRSFCG